MTTIQDVLSTLGIPFREAGEHHHVSPGWIGLECPQCSPNSGRFRLGVNLEYRYASCWQCGSVSLRYALQQATGRVLDWEEIDRLLGGLPPPARRHKPKGTFIEPAGIQSLFLPVHRTYLQNRGFDPDQIWEFWGVRGIGLACRLAWRLYIPIHHHGRTVSWTTRAILDDATQRYISARDSESEVPKRRLLYGADHVRHAAIVVEGPTDVWRIGPGAVATLGVAFSRAQVLILSRYPVRVVCFDNEPDAQKQAKKLCRLLHAFPGQTHLVELDAADPGSASKREVARLRRSFLS